MPKFTVYLMVPYCVWCGIDADSKDKAINKCQPPEEFDVNEPHEYFAIEEEEGV